jgi:hypothetical protein
LTEIDQIKNDFDGVEMKKIVMVLLLFASFLYAVNIIELKKETNTEIEIIFSLPEYRSHLIEKNSRYFEYFETIDNHHFLKTGEPYLPFFVTNLIIPDNDKMAIEIGTVEFEEIKVSTILPAGMKEDELIIGFSEIYQTDEWFPNTWAELSKPYILRDLRGITVQINPFHYNPQKGIVKIAKTIQIKLKSVGVSEFNTLFFKHREHTQAFESIYKNHFINFNSSVLKAKVEGEMLILTTEEYAEKVEPLIRWKNQKGIKTNLILYPNYTGSHWQDVKAFLQRQFEITNLTYVLLFGSFDFIARPISSKEDSASDWDYTFLSGDDSIPDILIGRLPVINEKEAEFVIKNLIQYEKNPLALQPELSGLVVSHEFMRMVPHLKNEQIYPVLNTASEQKVAQYFNQGLFWFLHDDSFKMTHTFFDLLNTVNYPPLVLYVSKFEDQIKTENDARNLLLSEFSEDHSSAVAYAKLQVKNPLKNQMQVLRESMLKADFFSLGTLMMEQILKSSAKLSASLSDEATSNLLFGDPSLLIYTYKPSELFVTHKNTIDISARTVSFSVQNLYGPLAGAMVAVSQDGILLQGARTNQLGEVSLACTEFVTDRRLLDVVVTAQNYIPYFGSIHFITGQEEKSMIPLIKADIYPNPYFSEGQHRTSQSNLSYELTERGQVRIAIYNSLGQFVKSVFDGEQFQGQYSFQWDGTDEFGRKVATGTYLYLIEVNQRTMSKKMLIIK